MTSEISAVGSDYVVESESHEYQLKPGESTAILIDNLTTWKDHWLWFRFFIKIGWHLLWHRRCRFTIIQQPKRESSIGVALGAGDLWNRERTQND